MHTIAFPQGHDSQNQPTRPPTLNLLQPLLELLSRRFPPHWLQRALEPVWHPVKPPHLPLLFPGRLSSRAPSRSPPRPPSALSARVPFHILDAAEAWGACEDHLESADAAPLRAELRALGALWLPRLPRPLAAVLAASSLACVGRVCMYEVRIGDSRLAGVSAKEGSGAVESKLSGEGGCSGDGRSGDPAALGLVIYHPQLARQRGGGGGVLRDVRRALHNGRAAVAEGLSLHSAVAVEVRSGGAMHAQWPMVEDDFVRCSDAGHLCAAFHLDSWMVVGDHHVGLSEAVPVATGAHGESAGGQGPL